jgi:hypothetical protein
LFFDRIYRIFRIFFPPGFPDENLETQIAFGNVYEYFKNSNILDSIRDDKGKVSVDPVQH